MACGLKHVLTTISVKRQGYQRPREDYKNHRKGIKIDTKDLKYKNRCDELNLNYIRYEKSGHDNNIFYTCNKHIDKGELHSKWCHLKTAKYGCKYCSGKGKNTNDFLKELGDITYELLSDYQGFEKDIICKCKICDNIWTTTPVSLYQGCACPICGNIKKGLSNRLTNDEFIRRMNKINPDIEFLEKYQTLKTPILCRCKKCNYEWKSTPDNLIYENINCPNCTSGKCEGMSGEILKNLNIGTVKRHVRFKDCKYINTLEFDYIIYDNEMNIIFACEYDGEQHYIPIDFSGKGKEYAMKQLEIVKLRDNIKNEYCKNNNIPIVRIPYWEKKNMKNYLLCKLINIINI